MSFREKIVNRDQQVLLSIEKIADGMTIDDISDDLNLSISSIRRTVAKLEQYGMLSGNWIKISGRWKRKYFISGEGTKDFIRALREALQS